MEIQLSTHDWLKLPMDTRIKLREIFNIPKSQGVVLEDNVVKSDGTTYEDLQAVTVEAMQEFLSSTEQDFVELFHNVIGRLDDEVEASIDEDNDIDPQQLLIDEWVALLSRMKGQAVEHNMTDHLRSAVTRVLDIKPLIPTQNAEGQKTKRKPRKKAK